MTLGNLLSQMGIGSKHLSERLSHGDYGGGGHDTHILYAYDPPHSAHVPVATSKHHHGGGGGHKSNAAMSALTLLAFLFFLHILQQCLKDHMTAMSTPPVIIMSSREGEVPISKTVAKLDKAGKTDTTDIDSKVERENNDSTYENDILLKINTAEHTPKLDAASYRKIFKNYGNRSLEYRGFVSAMDDGDFK